MKLASFKNLEKLYVFKQDQLAGRLSRLSRGVKFQYDEEYLNKHKNAHAAAIAFSMPLSEKSFELVGDSLPPFFAGLLPEGLRLKALISALKTSEDDLFSMLAASGQDLIGDVAISPQNSLQQILLNESALDLAVTSFWALFEQSAHAADYAARLIDPAIPGIYPKLSGAMISFPISIAKRRSRYILKLAPPELPKLVENEHFFMELAAESGLSVAKTQIVQDSKGVKGLLVQRFDRIWNRAAARITALHQEDACQFLNLYPQDKYRLSMRDIANGIRQFSSAPAIEISRLIQLYAFSYLIGNGDLHAKNISLLSSIDGLDTAFSPAYDLLSTIPYGDRQMALALEGMKDNLRKKHFLQFGLAYDIPAKAIKKSLDVLTSKVGEALEKLELIELPAKKLKDLKKIMLKRIEDLQ